MGKIQKLPETLIRLIAAGEVVERPASVVKELVENSLDAGATRISVDLWGAGRTRIRISDNGEGMSKEDAELALDRHATSKLRALDDLHALHTFGFRGEALPSIAAVSKLDLSTRTADAKTGWRIQLEGGKVLSSAPFGMDHGTTIDVQDLFFNTPARLKFLKKDGTERTHLLKTLQEMALAHPSVRFEVSMDGKSVMNLPASHELGGRVADAWGISVIEKLVPIDVTQGPVRIRGFVNAVPAHHASKVFQTLFVNNRPVQQRMLSHAIYEAYHEWLPVGRHPVFVLFVDIDPTLVDVNVHPTKREVRFTDERALYDVLYRRIRDLFRDRVDAPVVRQGESLASSFLPSNRGQTWSRPAEGGNTSTLTLEQAAAGFFSQSPLLQDTAPSIATPSFDAKQVRYLGQLKQVYLLAELEEDFLLIDQHAAAERVLYERILGQSLKRGAPRQALLTPLLWETSAPLAEIVRTYQKELEALGFNLEAFGPTTFALKEWPSALPQSRQAKRFLEEVIEALSNEHPTDKTVIQHQIAARAACRSAIMANDFVAPEEAIQLIKDLSACERPMTCPHGRPTHIRFPLTELHRRFRRT